MLELPMAPNCGDHAPTVRFESPDHVAQLHFGNVAVRRSAIDAWNMPLGSALDSCSALGGEPYNNVDAWIWLRFWLLDTRHRANLIALPGTSTMSLLVKLFGRVTS